MEGIALQNQYLEKVLRNPEEAHVLFLEHSSTLTLGYRLQESSVEREIELFKSKGYDIVRSERGGLLTLHNPGQLVCYPIVNLRTLGLGAREWIEWNLALIKQTLAAFGVPADYKMDSVGVFTEKGKIASLGVRIKNGVSTHGFAVNVKNDLRDFYEFNPCGLCSAGADGISNYVPEISLQKVRDVTSKFITGENS